MNIDERIEALTHSVELLSQMHQDNEKRYERYFAVVSDSLDRLSRIAENHEHRLSDLEGGRDKN